MAEVTTAKQLPKAFVKRRLHSLMGLWLTIFLIEHLLTNSQAALLLGDNAKGFVGFVNTLHNIPYLPFVEIFLFAIPIGLHGYYGIQYALQAKSNSSSSDGSTPFLNEGRNRAYSWQRITSWILLFMLIFHVTKFRFIEYPASVNMGEKSAYFVKVEQDAGLYTVASRLGAKVYDIEAILKEQMDLDEQGRAVEAADKIRKNEHYTIDGPEKITYTDQEQMILNAGQEAQQKMLWLKALKKRPISGNEVIVETKDFGTATLFSVRNTFKYPLYVALYTIFVLAACFHAFNGLWTFMISWGFVIRVASQKAMKNVSIALMALISLLGLAAIWGTYFLNLKY